MKSFPIPAKEKSYILFFFILNLTNRAIFQKMFIFSLKINLLYFYTITCCYYSRAMFSIDIFISFPTNVHQLNGDEQQQHQQKKNIQVIRWCIRLYTTHLTRESYFGIGYLLFLILLMLIRRRRKDVNNIF